MEQSIGVITIGQTPRLDMIPTFREFLPEKTTVIEKGVLDKKSQEEILALSPEPGQTVLVSRLKDGGKAVMAKEKILPMVQQLIDELNQKCVSLIVLACTGTFPVFESEVPIIYPDRLLNNVVKGVLQDGILGVVVPLPEQVFSIIHKWKEAGFHIIPAASSPYLFQEEKLIKAIQQLDQFPINAIVLDCMVYTEEMKQIAQDHTEKPVILSRNMIYSVAGEVL